MPNQWNLFDADHARELHQRHIAGESVLTLAKTEGISRITINRWFIKIGAVARNASDANRLRMEREGPEGRAILTRCAHAARRGKQASESELIRKAQTKSRMIGRGEAELFDALDRLGYAPEGQRACGPYNIDIAFRSIAVEISTYSNFAHPRIKERIKYLRDNGWCVVYVIFRSNADDLVGNLDNVIRSLQLIESNPSSLRQNWMIRCSAKRFSRCRDNLGRLTAIPAPVSYSYIVSEIDPG